MGLLKVHHPNFLTFRKECSRELKVLMSKYKATMIVMMKALQMSQQKAGEISFLNEAYIRLNFNQYYR